ncbi:class I SAM-dependent methyltransferase [Methylocystis sp. L43]|uniref:methyltransferase domain-containing protein n=1 Tax=unclassified Methylocystis TaxID=2625913 RepID=UPI0018C2B322|nr:class I SAM-dependent methyltransferase [Methylocystis sp. L43]MBG0805449.1 class I SAM-dependent methyltransferase [Methylocystis sp. H15]
MIDSKGLERAPVEKPDSTFSQRALSEDFAERRAKARERLDAVDPHKRPGGIEADPMRREWFEAVYALAEDDPAGVPWAHLEPRPLLEDWLAARSLTGLRALDVGCGLGDNAEALARAGAQVVAFDLVERAVQWARERFPRSSVDYHVADLFDAPSEWRGAFDLVHELYTLQALPEALLPDAARALAAFVAPGGTLLVISRARDEDEEISGPPWPLARKDIEAFAVDGLRLVSLEDIPPSGHLPRHWRAEFRRDEAGG